MKLADTIETAITERLEVETMLTALEEQRKKSNKLFVDYADQAEQKFQAVLNEDESNYVKVIWVLRFFLKKFVNKIILNQTTILEIFWKKFRVEYKN